MNSRARFGALAALALAVGGLAALPSANAMTGPTATAAGVGAHTVHICTTHPKPGFDTCLAVAVAGPDGKPLTSVRPLAGFTPSDVQAVYNLKGLKSGGATVAIVDAYGYSHLEADLKLYRKTYSLPACTTANGCLTIMDQHGGDNLPADNPSWDVEQALDVDAVSATCPDCKIIMVQAKNSSGHNLGIAVNQAAKHHVAAISNSYIGHDRKNMKYYDHPGRAITAGTGDGGFQGGQYPADDSHVVAVSGTTVVKSDSKRGYTETAWAGTGSGCAGKNPAPKWQAAAKTTCKTRAMGDVSAAANPGAGGLEICYLGHFEQVGGTSEATPIIAAVYALSGRTGGYPARFPYLNSSHLYDITEGSNGNCGVPLCQARKGWDGVTGVGTPNGVKGF